MTFEVLSDIDGILKVQINGIQIENDDVLGNDCIKVMLKNLTAFFDINTGLKWIIWNGNDCCYLWKLVKNNDEITIDLFKGDLSYQCYYEAVKLSETGICRHLFSEQLLHKDFSQCIVEGFGDFLEGQNNHQYDDQIKLLKYFVYSKQI